MTSLVSRKLHTLIPRITRAGVRCRINGGKLRIASSVFARRDFSKVVSGYTPTTRGIHNPAYVTLENTEEGADTEKRRRVIKSKEEDILDRMLYKLDMDVRRTGRALSIELAKAVRMVEQSGTCTANQALLVLRCCGEVLVDIDRGNRTKLVERYTNILKKNGVEFDINHYNAILRVHLENQKPVSAPDFVAEMEAAGITPNRVTFQHLVGLYCMEGNIMGATTILEHMKAQDMPISEAIFISLLKGHCANNDTESVSGTLDVMTSSGLIIGADAFAAMAYSYGRAGNWSKVEEVLSKAEEEDIKFDDGDIFSIILACSQGGLHEMAEGLVAKLPRRRGFFQEMRNHLPQLAMSGNVETAVQIYLSLEDREGGGREQMGLFVVTPIVKSGESVENVLKSVKMMKDAGYTNAIHYLVHEAAYHWSNEKCLKLVESIKKEDEYQFGVDTDLAFRSLRSTMYQERDFDRTMAAINNMHSMGIKVPFGFIQNDLLPAMINIHNELPKQTARRLRDACPFMSREITDALVLHCLYYKESIGEFRAATGLLLNAMSGFCYPTRWNLPIAKAYLKTNSLEDLITCLFVNSRDRVLGREPVQAADQLFKVLEYILEHTTYFYPNSDPESMLVPVLEELVRLHIGVPSKVVMALKEDVKSDRAIDLLDKAQVEWDNRETYWTVEAIAECFNERKKLHLQSKNSERDNNVRNINRYRGYYKIPETMEGMEEIQEILATRGEVNPTLSNNLISSYSSAGMVDKALNLINYTQRKRNEFNLSPTTHDAVATGLVEQGRVQEAIDLMEQQMTREGNRTFISTLMICLEGLAIKGEDQLVLDMIDKCDKEKFLEDRSDVNSVRVMAAYSKRGNVKMVEEVFNALYANKLITPESLVNLVPLIEVHLVNEDLKAAVGEFQRVVRVFKKMPHKYALTCRLIEEEDLEAVQEVLDISIGIIGEEKSLYDLAYCYLNTGRTDQARTLYRTPGLNYNHGLLGYQCHQLRDNKNLDTLEDLVAFTKCINGCDRNVLYQHLVSAYKDDADKVLDIWLLVQEEGFPPSDSLKTEIARALKAAGEPVPFEEPDEYMKVLHNSNVMKNELKEKKLPDTRMIDEEVYKALDMRDFSTATELVMGSFEQETTSLKCRKATIDFLTKEDRIEDAAMLATRLAKGFKKPRNIRFKKLYHNIVDKLEDEEKDIFINGLGSDLAEILKRPKQNSTLGDEALSKSEEPVDEKKIDSTTRKSNVAPLQDALSVSDMTGVLEGLENLELSHNRRNQIVKELIANNKLADAAKAIIAVTKNKNNDESKSKKAIGGIKLTHAYELMAKWEEAGEVYKTIEFLNEGGEILSKAVRGNNWVKNGLARTDLTGYINLIKENPDDYRKWLLNSEVIAEAVDKNPALLSTLEFLAVDNFVPASILLSKWAIMKQDSEMLEKHINICPYDVKMFAYGGMFDKLDTTEKMDMVMAVLRRNNAEKEVLETVGNNCLSMNLQSDDFLDIVDKVLESGVELGSLRTSALRQLAANTDFRLINEAQNILDTRATK